MIGEVSAWGSSLLGSTLRLPGGEPFNHLTRKPDPPLRDAHLAPRPERR